MPVRDGMKKRVYRKRAPGRARRYARKTNRYAVKTYAFKRHAKPFYLINNNEADPTSIESSDFSQIDLSPTVSDSVINGSYNVTGAMTPQLLSVIDAADFTSLYDQYRIAGIKYTFTPLKNVNTQSTNYVIPELVIARDLDDVTPPTNDTQDLLQRQDAKLYRLTRPVSVYCKPGVLIAQSGTGANIVPFGSARRNVFIDMATPDVVHPCFKFAIRNAWLGTPAEVQSFMVRVDVTYYLLMKNVK